MDSSKKELDLREMEQVNGGGFFDMSDEEREYHLNNSPSRQLWRGFKMFLVFLEGFGSP